MLESAILGAVQGIAEWLPISSEGLLFLIKTNFLGADQGIEVIVKEALFLHLGTFLAALIYFWKNIILLIRGLFIFKSASLPEQKTLKFLIMDTLISGLVGFLLLNSQWGTQTPVPEFVKDQIQSAPPNINVPDKSRESLAGPQTYQASSSGVTSDEKIDSSRLDMYSEPNQSTQVERSYNERIKVVNDKK